MPKSYTSLQGFVRKISDSGKSAILYLADLSESQVAEFNTHPVMQKLVQIVRQEKPDFRPIIRPQTLVAPVYVTPRKLHNRIIAQNGAFVLFGFTARSQSGKLPGMTVSEIHIGSEHKQRIARELDDVGINESTLFPEIEKAALAIKRRYE